MSNAARGRAESDKRGAIRLESWTVVNEPGKVMDVDAVLVAAARALDSGNLLEALKRVSLREDAPALGLRGVIFARMGQFARARELLAKAARAFGPSVPLGRARCLLADAEIALATRDLRGVDAALGEARRLLAAERDLVNAAHATCLAARSALLRGQIQDAERLLGGLETKHLPPLIAIELELARTEAYRRKPAAASAQKALQRAERWASAARITIFSREIAAQKALLAAPAASALSRGHARSLTLTELETLLTDASSMLVDARELAVRGNGTRVELGRRPVLFALVRALAEAWPEPAARARLIAQAFGAKRVNESHRARLRVELARLRRALGSLASIAATREGFALTPLGGRAVTLLTSPQESEHEPVLALLRDGEAWASSALSVALGKSQRSVQRVLGELEVSGQVRSAGRARAKRFFCAPPEIATPLLLPVPDEIA